MRDGQPRTQPYIQCDVCSQPIEDVRKALAIHFDDGSVQMVHKNMDGFNCDRDRSAKCTELEHFLFRICYNSKMDFTEADKSTSKLMDYP